MTDTKRKAVGTADPNCSTCDGTGTVRNSGDRHTNNVEAAAAFAQRHADSPTSRVCKCWYSNEMGSGA